MGLEKINEYKKLRNLTNKDISDITGISISSLDKITSGKNTNPKFETVKLICSALDCNWSDLLDDNHGDELTPQEKNHIKKYRTLDSYGQKAVSAVLNIEYERCSSSEDAVIDTARIAAYGGGTKDIPAANVTKEELEQLEALQRGLNEVAEIEKKLRK